jgi:FkbM family methyltransferase
MGMKRLAFHIFDKTFSFGLRMRRLVPRRLLPFISIVSRFLSKHLVPHGTRLIETQGQKMYLDSHDMGIAAAALADGSYEQCETNLIKSIVQEGMICADLGAHVGYYTLLMAGRVGAGGKIFAFEPDPNNYALLLKNIEANGFKNVAPVQKAVSGKSGIARLFLSPDNGRSRAIWDPHKQWQSVAVDVVSLDDFFQNQDYPKVIKMDVEGTEMEAILGMSGLIKKSGNLTIIVEVHPKGIIQAGSSPAQFVQTLLEYGFRLSVLEEPTTVKPLGEAAIIELCKRREAVTLYCEKRT